MKIPFIKLALPVGVGIAAFSFIFFLNARAAVASILKKGTFSDRTKFTFSPKASALKKLKQDVQENKNRDTLKTLAQYQLAIGDTEGWYTNMLAILDLPYNRDAFTETHQEIARVFLDRGEWEAAAPYVDPATQRWDWWALQGTAWYYGIMGETLKGLEYTEIDASHHKSDTIVNYILSFDAQPSEWSIELMDELYSRNAKGNPVDRAKAANIAYIRKGYDDAVNLLSQALAISRDPWYGIMAALYCEQQEWNERRDKILKQAIELYPKLPDPSPNRKGMRRFLDMYIEANNAGISDPLERELIAYSRSYTHEAFNVDAHALAGELLRLKGHHEAATDIFQEIISINYRRRISEYIPYRGLRLMNIDPAIYLKENRPVQP